MKTLFEHVFGWIPCEETEANLYKLEFDFIFDRDKNTHCFPDWLYNERDIEINHGRICRSHNCDDCPFSSSFVENDRLLEFFKDKQDNYVSIRGNTIK